MRIAVGLGFKLSIEPFPKEKDVGRKCINMYYFYY